MTLESTPAKPPTYEVVVAPAEVDLASSAELRTDIEDSLFVSPWVIVDLSAVEFIDSTGLTVLMGGRKQAQLLGGDLVLVGAGLRTLKMLRITQLDRVFGLYSTIGSVPPPGAG